MKEKYLEFLLRFYKPKSRQLNLLSDGGVISNSVLKRENYGSNGNSGFCIWTNSTCSNKKINKQTKRKRNTRRKRLNHCSKTLRYGGVISNTELKILINVK